MRGSTVYIYFMTQARYRDKVCAIVFTDSHSE